MANKGSGYGGGGAGGGESSNDSFTEPSAGCDGYAVVIEVQVAKSTTTSKLKVKVSNTDYYVHMLEKPTWDSQTSQSWASSKLTFSTGLSRSSNGTRTWSLNPFTVGSAGTYSYHEFISASGFNSDIKLATTKAVHDGTALKAIYSASNKTSVSYIKRIAVSSLSQTGGNYTPYHIPVGSSNTTTYVYVLIQGGGGGGGGADNNWGLFNYAAGGGGGGGGAARLIKATLVNQSYDCYVQVGHGGAAASNQKQDSDRLSGGDGYGTYVYFYNNATGAKDAEAAAFGGKGGVRAYGNCDPGAGGSGGQTDYKNYNGEIISVIRTVDGGSGGSVGSGGAVATSGSSSDTIATDLFTATLSIDTGNGSGGGVGSCDDRGGGGGASWLGNGGYY